MESSNYEIAHDLWNSFRDAVMFKERFFLNHPVLDKLVEIARGREVTIDPGKVYYRARIIDEAAQNEHMLAKCYSPNATEEERIRPFAERARLPMCYGVIFLTAILTPGNCGYQVDLQLATCEHRLLSHGPLPAVDQIFGNYGRNLPDIHHDG